MGLVETLPDFVNFLPHVEDSIIVYFGKQFKIYITDCLLYVHIIKTET